MKKCPAGMATMSSCKFVEPSLATGSAKFGLAGSVDALDGVWPCAIAHVVQSSNIDTEKTKRILPPLILKHGGFRDAGLRPLVNCEADRWCRCRRSNATAHRFLAAKHPGTCRTRKRACPCCRDCLQRNGPRCIRGLRCWTPRLLRGSNRSEDWRDI